MTELDDFRAEKDDFFGRHPQSPLTREQKREFKGLAYFPENPDMRLEVPVEQFNPKDTIEMQTSTGDVQTYQRYGRFNFSVDGQEPIGLAEGDHVDVRSSKYTASFVRFGDPNYFYRNLTAHMHQNSI